MKKLPIYALLTAVAGSMAVMTVMGVAGPVPTKDTKTHASVAPVTPDWVKPKPTYKPTPIPTHTTAKPVPIPTKTTSPPVTSAPRTTPPPSTGTDGKSLVFSAPFTDTSNWVLGKTSSYPGSQPQTNPGDNKLDHLRYGVAGPAKRFSAQKIDGVWWTDLVTTEGTSKNFKVKTGDELDATITLNSASQMGAWPAIWTWGSGSIAGHGEVDLFEYHPDNPRLLELSNHITESGAYVDKQISPGVPFNLKVKFEAKGVQWFVNDKNVYTGYGLPTNWSASLIVNMSVSAGKYHPAPSASVSQLYMDVENLRVYR